MNRSLSIGVLTAAVLASLLPVPAAKGAPATRSSYIVVLKPAAGDPGVVAEEHGRDRGAHVSFVYRNALRGYSATIPSGSVGAIRADSRVAYVSEDRAVTIDGHSSGTAPTGVHRTFSPDNPNIDIDGNDDLRVDADVAILDTGIDTTHPDLNVVGGKNCQRGRSYDDGNGHGTHVAGTVAGLDNGAGVVGTAPGARLWAVKVLSDSGSGSWSSVLCGVDWVTGLNTDSTTSNDIEVANMSLGGSGSEPSGSGCSTGDALHDGICRSVAAGATYVVAAGNSSEDATKHVPAAYDEVITVSALADFDGIAGGLAAPTCRTDVDDTFATFSNYGPEVDLIAPGVCIKSTWKDGGYNTISGTSMASPHVAGAALLYKATVATATPEQVKTALHGASNLGWSNVDDPDPVQEGLLDVRDPSVFAPAMVETGGSTTPPPASISLVAKGYKVKSLQKVDLSWSGAGGLSVDVMRDSGSGYSRIATVDATTYTDNINKKGSATYTYKVCTTGTSTCSNEATVIF